MARTIRPRSSGFLAARLNPLSMERVTRVGFRFPQHDWDWQIRRLHKLGYRGAVVGAQGSGKTTLLLELCSQFSHRQIEYDYLFLPQEKHRHSQQISDAIVSSRSGKMIIVDGIERITIFARRRLVQQTRNGPGLIVAVHQPLRFPVRLPTWIHCQTNADLMADILGTLGLDYPEIQTAGKIAFENSGGNIRNALRDLYDQFASGRFATIRLE